MLKCVKCSEGGLIRELDTFHIVHSPRFPLLASLKLMFGTGTSVQKFDYSSPAIKIDPVGPPINSSSRNSRVEVFI